jgi:hypothetical protein
MSESNKWLITVDALDSNNQAVTLRFSSGGYVDTSDNYYDDRVIQAALFTNSLFAGSMYSAVAKPGFGETTLVNTDGGLDYLVDYAIDGRTCVVSLVKNNVITEILSGTATGLYFNDKTISIKLKDYQVTTDQVHPYSSYAGNNILPDGLEGTSSDIKGNKKPRIYGRVKNVKPVLVNTARYIYEVHDTTINPDNSVEITAVYDRGVLLDKHTHYTDLNLFMTDSVPSGKYITYKGYFKLGSLPSGEITCDAERDIITASEVLEDLLSEVSLQYDVVSKVSFPSYEVGFIVEGEDTTSAILERLCNGCGYYWYFNGNVVKTDSFRDDITSALTIDDSAIIDIRRSSSGAGSNGIPYKKVIVKGDRCHTVQTDLASSVSIERKAFTAVEYREANVESALTIARHLLAEELIIESDLNNLTDCNTVAQNLLDYFSVRRDTVECTAYLPEIQSSIQIGSAVEIYSSKLGYSSGKVFVITGFTVDARRQRVELKLLG